MSQALSCEPQDLKDEETRPCGCLKRPCCISVKSQTLNSRWFLGFLQTPQHSSPFSSPFFVLSLGHTLRGDINTQSVPGTVLHIDSSKQPSQVYYYLYTPLLQKRKPRHRKVRYLAQVTKLVHGDNLRTSDNPPSLTPPSFHIPTSK